MREVTGAAPDINAARLVLMTHRYGPLGRPRHALGNSGAYPDQIRTMVKVCHLDTFSMGETGPHIAIMVLSVVPHFKSMVYSKILASSASVGDCGVVWDDRREPPRI